MGSGNLVHNLHTYAWGKHEVAPFDWEPWRAERKSLVIKLHTERIEAAKAKTKAA